MEVQGLIWKIIHFWVIVVVVVAVVLKVSGAGEMDQWLRVLIALPEGMGSIPTTHVVAHNYL